MFLFAGLLGMVASGALLMAPLWPDTDEEEVAEDRPAETEQEDETEGSSPLSVASDEASDADTEAPLRDTGAAPDGRAATQLAPLPPQVAEATTSESLAAPDAPLRSEGPDEVPREPARDQAPGAHMTDRIQGSWASPIHFDSDAMFGNGGADEMRGGAGDDLMLGDEGDDTLTGGEGRDEVQGGRGDDALDGDEGDDILWGEDGDDVLDGSEGRDMLLGGEGDDTLDGGDGDDSLFGGEGRDVMSGGDGNDVLDGSAARDGVEMDEGDTLSGGDGDDTLAGGAGDVLNGGEGSDHFLFRAAPPVIDSSTATAPWIEDFDPGVDVIEIGYAGDGDGDTPQLEITRTEEGSELRLDGALVARVAGLATVTAANVQLIAEG